MYLDRWRQLEGHNPWLQRETPYCFVYRKSQGAHPTPAPLREKRARPFARSRQVLYIQPCKEIEKDEKNYIKQITFWIS